MKALTLVGFVIFLLGGMESLIKVGVSLISVLLTVFLAEGAIRLISMRKNIYSIEMVKYAQQLKMPDPSGANSHVHRPKSSARLMGSEISINSLGHRGPEPSLLRADKRLYVLGSSVTMGWGVKYSAVFSSVVQSRLNSQNPFGELSFEILNAGIGNYNSKAQYHLFNKQYPSLSPDMVILHYFINDAETISAKTSNPIYKYSFLAGYLADWSRSISFLLFQPTDLAGYYASLYSSKSAEWLETQNYIRKIKDTLSQDGRPFVAMIVPDFHRLEADSPYAPIYATVEKSFQNLNVPTVNLFPIFQEKYGTRESELWIQADDPHPNEKGHLVMANELYRYLVENNPLGLQSQDRPL